MLKIPSGGGSHLFLNEVVRRITSTRIISIPSAVGVIADLGPSAQGILGGKWLKCLEVFAKVPGEGCFCYSSGRPSMRATLSTRYFGRINRCVFFR